MAHEAHASARRTLEGGFRIAERYRIEQMLGRGGVATVYAAVDEESDQQVALKYLMDSPASPQVALFQREYHTLAQTTHPGIIRVFEYGITEAGPFYTMELLDGHDLREAAPVPWPEACRLLRDVASALAILHSRRLVHRDLSHANVRLTADGRAKLIDFGAMAPMGFAPNLIGTPPFLSPEAVYGEPLDQRADLYALGALGYWLLTGRHRYPAATVRELRRMWSDAKLRHPFELAPGVPHALAQLLQALMHEDPMARPGSAAEIIDRLSAIAGLAPSDEPSVAQSYLTNPKLIGRQHELARLTIGVERAVAGAGGVLAIRGSYGAGKSRLLQEAVMHAKLAGVTVLQAPVRAAGRDGYAIASRLVDELLAKLPQSAAKLAPSRAEALGWLLPALREHAPQGAEPPKNAREQQARACAELSAWLIELSRDERLLLAIDDVDACDEESLAVLAGLSGSPGPTLLVSLRHKGPGLAPAIELLLSRAADVIDLQALSTHDTERLVASLFGSSPNSQRVADWLREHAGGNPLECIELARYLVEQGAAYYTNGAWILPHELPVGVPRGLAEAFATRVAGLDAGSRALAEVLALYAKPARLAFCLQLSDTPEKAELFSSLSQLVSAEIVTGRGDEYSISREGIREALLRGLSVERRRAVHQRIAEALLARGPGDTSAQAEAAYHLLRGYERLRGVTLLEQALVVRETLLETGEGVIPALELALEVAETAGLPPARSMRLRARLAMCAYFYDKKLLPYADPLLDQLYRDSGLAYWPELPQPSCAERLQRAVALAQERYAQTPDERRGMPPFEALRTLGPVVTCVLGVASFEIDLRLLDRLAELVAPLAELDKRIGIAIVYDIVTTVREATYGRVTHAASLRNPMLERLRDPQMYQGIAEEHRKSLRATQTHTEGMRVAGENPRRALALADEIDSLGMKMYAGAALQIRLLVHLYRGEPQAIKECQLRLESLSVPGSAGGQTEIWLLSYLTTPYSFSGDVMGLKRTAERLALMVTDNRSYRPLLDIALGAYHRERGQFAESKVVLERALQLVVGRRAGVWAAAMSQYIETLVAADECERALALAHEHFDVKPDEHDRARYYRQVLPVIALAEARLGATDRAAGVLDREIALAQAEDQPLLIRFRLHRARASVAICAGDAAAFELHAEHAAELCRSVNNSVLMLKHLALIDEAARHGMAPRSVSEVADALTSVPTVQHSRVTTASDLDDAAAADQARSSDFTG